MADKETKKIVDDGLDDLFTSMVEIDKATMESLKNTSSSSVPEEVMDFDDENYSPEKTKAIIDYSGSTLDPHERVADHVDEGEIPSEEQIRGALFKKHDGSGIDFEL